jgi:hypothetical protein
MTKHIGDIIVFEKQNGNKLEYAWLILHFILIPGALSPEYSSGGVKLIPPTI